MEGILVFLWMDIVFLWFSGSEVYVTAIYFAWKQQCELW